MFSEKTNLYETNTVGDQTDTLNNTNTYVQIFKEDMQKRKEEMRKTRQRINKLKIELEKEEKHLNHLNECVFRDIDILRSYNAHDE